MSSDGTYNIQTIDQKDIHNVSKDAESKKST